MIHSLNYMQRAFEPNDGCLRVKQTKITQICHILHHLRVFDKIGLCDKLQQIIRNIRKHPKIFKNYDSDTCFAIFKQAVQVYEMAQDRLRPGQSRWDNIKLQFQHAFNSMKRTEAQPEDQLDSRDPIYKIARSYDRLEKAVTKIESASAALEIAFCKQDYIVIPHVILGCGDAGTTLWLEKYAKSYRSPPEGQLPEVIMIGQDMGNWKHDYVLAQPHSLLERGDAQSNPAEFISDASYLNNPYVNARHLYQSNLINLAKTKAPLLLNTTVLGIEKKEKHAMDWESKHPYRLKVRLNRSIKFVYTQELDICSGLGGARKDFPRTFVCSDSVDRLMEYDQERKFTPIVDGDQFVLGNNENQSHVRRTILLYGGGGTATAAFRKAFFGEDKTLKNYADNLNKHDLFWVSNKGFDKAGKGKLAKEALHCAMKMQILCCGVLKRINYDAAIKKLHVYFELNDEGVYNKTAIRNPIEKLTKCPAVDPNWHKIECDQLIHSVGQNSEELRSLCQELKEDLSLDLEIETLMPIGMQTKDGRVHFFGGAAQASGGIVYTEAMNKWIKQSRINKDSSATAVMPPSRAMIKKHAFSTTGHLTVVNANIDDQDLIGRLLNSKQVKPESIAAFISDVFENRKQTTSGMTHERLDELLHKHALEDRVMIQGQTLLRLV